MLVTLLTPEPRSLAIATELERRTADNRFISSWTLAEFASAVARKLRMGRISPFQRDLVMREIRLLQRESLGLLAVTDHDVRNAAAFVEASRMPLRAPDALHLSISANHGLLLLTRDAGLGQAAELLGLKVELLD